MLKKDKVSLQDGKEEGEYKKAAEWKVERDWFFQGW